MTMAMPTRLRALILEDNASDIELVLHELEKAGFDTEWQRVETEEEFLAQLAAGWDIVIADYHLPQFDALQAIRRVRERHIDLPVIVITGIVGDEAAAECIKEGAVDYLLKDRLARLGVAVRRALLELAQKVQQREADRLLRESEARFRTLVEALPQIVWTARPDGHLDYYNRCWYEFTGFAEGESGDQSWEPILHPDDLATCHEHWYTAVRSGSTFRIEYRFKDRKTGGYRWFLGCGEPLRDPQGEILKWFGTCTDIDDQKRLAESLLRHNAELEEFAFGTAHDLQEPLRVVIVQVQLLARKCERTLDDEANILIANVVASAERMRHLLQSTLAYAQLSRDEVCMHPVESLAALHVALSRLAAVIEENSAAITHGPLPPVLADTAQLAQVFEHLIENAIKYQRKDCPPRVHVSAEIKDRQVTFGVADNGVGIEPQYAERIFRLFKRLHGPDVPGAGVGLAFCEKIIERHGGRMWVKCGGGIGATFYFTLRGAYVLS